MTRRHPHHARRQPSEFQQPEIKAIPLTQDKPRDGRLLVAAMIAASVAAALTLVAQFTLG
ncbi:hypothetical protein GCM10027040_32550 [Halomonas shantousis]